MCFVKSSAPAAVAEPQEAVERKEADASATKTSQIEKNSNAGFKQNLKTSATGLEENAKTDKKTFLGE